MRVVAIGDTHFPFCDRRHLDSVIRFIEREKPDAVVQMGDIFDLFSYSRYERLPGFVSPGEEVTSARSQAEQMWERVQKAAPRAECYQVLGNHDGRLLKSVARLFPDIEAVLQMLDYRQLWEFPGVLTAKSMRDVIELDGVTYTHGWLAQPGRHAAFFGKPCVVGHTHRGGVWCDASLWELNAGYIADQSSPAFGYTFSVVSRSVPGFGFIDRHGPRFVRL